MARLLALDVGERRIGVAISDDGGRFASPLTTVAAVPHARAIASIVAIVRDYQIGAVVIGLPLTMRGERGWQANIVERFAADITAALEECADLAPVGVLFFDERFTTTVAEQRLRDLGITPAKRKARIDEMAACILLQDYLDSRTHEPWRVPNPDAEDESEDFQ